MKIKYKSNEKGIGKIKVLATGWYSESEEDQLIPLLKFNMIYIQTYAEGNIRKNKFSLAVIQKENLYFKFMKLLTWLNSLSCEVKFSD